MYEIKDLETHCLSLSFPEMHEVVLKDSEKTVGILSLIAGKYTVEYPDINGEIIFERYPLGKHCFEHQEREYWINQGLEALVKKLNSLEERGNDEL